MLIFFIQRAGTSAFAFFTAHDVSAVVRVILFPLQLDQIWVTGAVSDCLFCFWYVFCFCTMNMYVPLCMSFDIYCGKSVCECLWKLSLAFLSHLVNKLYFPLEVICILFSLHQTALWIWMPSFSGRIQQIPTSLCSFRVRVVLSVPSAFTFNSYEFIISHCCTVKLKGAPLCYFYPQCDDFVISISSEMAHL